jgi:hypothetical protein
MIPGFARKQSSSTQGLGPQLAIPSPSVHAFAKPFEQRWFEPRRLRYFSKQQLSPFQFHLAKPPRWQVHAAVPKELVWIRDHNRSGVPPGIAVDCEKTN